MLRKEEYTFRYALEQFEAIEANLSKLERLWSEMIDYIPSGTIAVTFGYHSDYEDRRKSYIKIMQTMPRIDDWQLTIEPVEFEWIGQQRYADLEFGLNDAESLIAINSAIYAPEVDLQEYRYQFNDKRRELVRTAINEIICKVDTNLTKITNQLGPPQEDKVESLKGSLWDELSENVRQIDTLLGSSVKRPLRWSDLRRHISFGTRGDYDDIVKRDWPSIKAELKTSLHGPDDPLPMEVNDLSHLVGAKLKGPIPTKLHWDRLSPDDFERLIFALISTENETYENPEWLMKTNAPDRGRDISAFRVFHDAIGGTTRLRAIVQCKHWLKRSVKPSDISDLKEQITLWEPPRIDVCIVATTGRFTSDAVAIVEKHNQSNYALRIEMWPDSHLELVIAKRPDLIAEFGLR